MGSSAFITIENALKFPAIFIKENIERRIYQGKNILIKSKDYNNAFAINNKKKLLAIGSISKNTFKIKKVLNL